MIAVLLVYSSSGPLTKTVELPGNPVAGEGLEISPKDGVTWLCVVTGIIWRLKPAVIITVLLKSMRDGKMEDIIPEAWVIDLVEDGWHP